jgi:hypothetical protein
MSTTPLSKEITPGSSIAQFRGFTPVAYQQFGPNLFLYRLIGTDGQPAPFMYFVVKGGMDDKEANIDLEGNGAQGGFITFLKGTKEDNDALGQILAGDYPAGNFPLMLDSGFMDVEGVSVTAGFGSRVIWNFAFDWDSVQPVIRDNFNRMILSSTELGDNVKLSSLERVGTLSNLDVGGEVYFNLLPYGDTPFTLYYDLNTGKVTWANSPGNVDLTPLTLDAANGRVGIMNPLPQYELDVQGAARVTDGMEVQNGIQTSSLDIQALNPGEGLTVVGDIAFPGLQENLTASGILSYDPTSGDVDYIPKSSFVLPLTLDKVNSRVGINNTSPQYALDVNDGGINIPNINAYRIATKNAVSFAGSDFSTVAVGQTGTIPSASTRGVAIGIGANIGAGSVSVGNSAGANGQGASAIAIGPNAGTGTQGNNAVAIGNGAGTTSQSLQAVCIGFNSGASNQGQQSIAIGSGAGNTSQSTNSIAVGAAAGNSSQGNSCVAVGTNAGQYTQGASAVAIGLNAGTGTSTAGTGQGASAVAIGNNAGNNTQGVNSVAIGNGTGNLSQGAQALAIGNNAGNSSQGINSIAFGASAGRIGQNANAIAIGTNAGNNTQGAASVAIGLQAAETTQSNNAVAIGIYAGQNKQGASAIAIGQSAGSGTATAGTGQGQSAIAIGQNAGNDSQKSNAVAIGQSAGQTGQGLHAIAIGRNAGNSTQGAVAIAIGQSAGRVNQHANSIILNATGSDLDSASVSSLYIKPIRQLADASLTSLSYNPTTGEVTYGNTSSSPFALTTTNTATGQLAPDAFTTVCSTVITAGVWAITADITLAGTSTVKNAQAMFEIMAPNSLAATLIPTDPGQLSMRGNLAVVADLPATTVSIRIYLPPSSVASHSPNTKLRLVKIGVGAGAVVALSSIANALSPISIDATNKRIGIDQPSPTKTLDVNGDARITGSLNAQTGSPEGVTVGVKGSMITRTDGADANELVYYKTVDDVGGNNTKGWIALQLQPKAADSAAIEAAPKYAANGVADTYFKNDTYYKYVGFVDTVATPRSFLGFQIQAIDGSHAGAAGFYKGSMNVSYGGSSATGSQVFPLNPDADGWVFFQPSGWPALAAQRMPITLEFRVDYGSHSSYVNFVQSGKWDDGREFYATATFVLQDFNANTIKLEHTVNHVYNIKCIGVL